MFSFFWLQILILIGECFVLSLKKAIKYIIIKVDWAALQVPLCRSHLAELARCPPLLIGLSPVIVANDSVAKIYKLFHVSARNVACYMYVFSARSNVLKNKFCYKTNA